MRMSETFVMAQVEIGFRAIVGDEDFAMLKRRHRTGVYVDVGVELDQCDAQAACFQQAADRRSRQTFPQTGNYTAGDENVFRHRCLPQLVDCNIEYASTV